MTREACPGRPRNGCRSTLRLRHADLAIIDRAACRRGQSRTGFIREAALQTAEEARVTHTPIRMSPTTGFGAFRTRVAGLAVAQPAPPELR